MKPLGPGDRALIIKDYPGCEANIGRVARIVSGPELDDESDFMFFEIEPDNNVPFAVVDHDTGVVYLDTRDIEIPAPWLAPLNDPDVEAEIRDAQLLAPKPQVEYAR